MKKTILITGLASFSLIAGCQTTAQKAEGSERRIVSEICKTLPAISYDGNQDTQETKDQIKKYNARRDTFCRL